MKHKTLSVYIALLFLAFHYYLFVYINSNFLATFVGNKTVGYLYILASIVSVISLLHVEKWVAKFGNVRFATGLALAEIVALVALATSSSFQVIAIAFIMQHVLNPLLIFCLDIFLESSSRNEETGRNRGLFLTILNAPAIFGAFLSGAILVHAEYYKVYLTSALFLLPLLATFLFGFHRFRDPVYKETRILEAMERFRKKRPIRDIFIDNVILQFFYALMTIYFPIYLYQNIGLSLSSIGIIIAVGLFPFIFLQIPVGKLVDKRFTEKEFLIASFLLMGLSTAAVTFISTSNIFVWIGVILLTRVGASIVEIGTESFFFKHVGERDADLIGLFRMSHGIAFALMPLIGIALLIFIQLQYLFVVLGIVILILGLRYAFDLEERSAHDLSIDQKQPQKDGDAERYGLLADISES